MANGKKPTRDATAALAKSDAARAQAAGEVKEILTALKDLAPDGKTPGGKALWFPHGITLLHVSAKVGIDVKGLTFEVKIQGPEKPLEKPGASEPEPKPALPA